jgi:small subunit ribosomal protein S3Ae
LSPPYSPENYTENLKNRVFTFNLADLNKNQNLRWRNVKLQVEEIKDQDCYTGFYGMSTTRDKICQLVKKWQSTIEAFVQVKTKDGYLLRLFSMGFTARRKRQVKATCYAANSQTRSIKKKMQEIMIAEVQKHSLKDLIKVL